MFKSLRYLQVSAIKYAAICEEGYPIYPNLPERKYLLVANHIQWH